MVVITEDLIRKRAEHNECLISTLEEVSLHQQDIEKIEYIDKWCKELKILYLQSNLIPKIENVSKLKKLEYLNLALNNVEHIENLEACESLRKLDLTVNFIGELTSIKCLKDLYALRELFLTGNPCADYTGYRQYVIAMLRQLTRLDGIEIEISERIKAIQALPEVEKSILEQQEKYRRKREQEKKSMKEKEDKKAKKHEPGFDGRWYTDINSSTNEEDENKNEEDVNESEIAKKDKEFWDEKIPFTPESRIAVHEQLKAQRERKDKKDSRDDVEKRVRRLVTDDGRVLNVNEAGVDFTLKEDVEDNTLVLDVSVFKHMDTSLCDVDVQPTHVKVTLKGKVLQIVLPEEVKTDASTAKRSQITGHLLITMPKVTESLVKATSRLSTNEEKTKQTQQQNNVRRRETLEVDPSSQKTVDFANIVNETPKQRLLGDRPPRCTTERPNSDDFIDDPSVPPLM